MLPLTGQPHTGRTLPSLAGRALPILPPLSAGLFLSSKNFGRTSSQCVRVGADVSSGPETTAGIDSNVSSAKETLYELVAGVGGRGRAASEAQKKAIDLAVQQLEQAGGIPEPASSPSIQGTWQLMYTTRPGSASPIQRTFVGVDAFTVYQTIDVQNAEDPRVVNTIEFSPKLGKLKVEAAASIANPRRISFCFDRAAFFLPFWPHRVPYPVPFRLLGDEAKGWLDTTYLDQSGELRISRGNKGTTFILQKRLSLKQQLLISIKSKRDITQVVSQLQKQNPSLAPARDQLLSAKWRLIYTSQSSDANAIQKATAGLAQNWQVVNQEDEFLENVVEILPGIVLRARAEARPSSDVRTDVVINGASLKVGPLSVPLPIRGEGYIDQLYLDKTLRISRGNKGSLFIHTREIDS